MPYIPTADRPRAEHAPRTPGELNFAFTRLILRYLSPTGVPLSQAGITYQHLNDVLGALEGAKLEFVRRVVNPYEDQKITSAGDVYPA